MLVMTGYVRGAIISTGPSLIDPLQYEYCDLPESLEYCPLGELLANGID